MGGGRCGGAWSAFATPLNLRAGGGGKRPAFPPRICIHIYIYAYICTYVCIYTYIHIRVYAYHEDLYLALFLLAQTCVYSDAQASMPEREVCSQLPSSGKQKLLLEDASLTPPVASAAVLKLIIIGDSSKRIALTPLSNHHHRYKEHHIRIRICSRSCITSKFGPH